MGGFVNSVASVSAQTVRLFDNHNRLAYSVLCFQFVAAGVLMFSRGMVLSPALVPPLIAAISSLLLCRLVLPRYGRPKTSGAVEAVAIIYLQGAAGIMMLIPLAEISLPFADDAIAASDAMLGFHWPSFARIFANDQALYSAAAWFYGSFVWQSLIVIPVLFFKGMMGRAWAFVSAATLAALICILIFPFFPAQGPTVHYQLNPADYPTFSPFAWWFGPALEEIKSGAINTIEPHGIFAMVSVPSFHTVASILFTWAMWKTKLRWAFVILNAGMLVATIVVGVHYLTDLVAGAAVAIFALWFATRSLRAAQD